MPTVAHDNMLCPLELRPLPAEPLVSILLSNYNYATYIGDSLQSALEQTYKNFELIICDDGSTDNSVAVIEQFVEKDSRIQFIRKENGGQASGFNAAFTASRGEIIALLDSDDLYLPTKIEKIVANFQANPDCGFGLHRIIRINTQMQRQGVWPMSAELPKGWFGAKLMGDGGILAFMPPTSGLSFRRQIADRMFPLPLYKPLVNCPDQVITRLAPLITNVTREDEALSLYRLHNNNNYGPERVTAAFFKRELEYCDALWGAQRDFLEKMDPRLAEEFQPVSRSHYILYNKFLYARLAKSPDVKEHYDRYMKSLLGFDQRVVKDLWFWKSSPYMPHFLFDFILNLMIRQSRLKQLVARIKKMG